MEGICEELLINKVAGSNYLEEWFSKSPKYTTLRINKLRGNLDINILKTFLHNQMQELNVTDIPKIYFKGPDCLVIEQWLSEEPKLTGREVIVDALCAAAVLRGAHVFAPGVMGLPCNIKLNDIADVYGDLKGKCKKGLKIPFEGSKMYVGIGYMKQTRKDLFDETAKPSGIAVHITMPSSRLPVINERLYPEGHVLLQNLPSIVCGWVMDVTPGERVLDMCAAPGNKTTHLAEMSSNQASIIAIDKTNSKVEKIRHNCKLHGITCVKSYVFDSTKIFSGESRQGIDKLPLSNKVKEIIDDPPFSENNKYVVDQPPFSKESFRIIHQPQSPEESKLVVDKLILSKESVKVIQKPQVSEESVSNVDNPSFNTEYIQNKDKKKLPKGIVNKPFSEERILNTPPFPENSFDKILLDAPCSGLGQRPLLKCKMTPKMLESYKFVQRKLMSNAVKLLKIGGKLVYSTCTITKEENEGMVAWALDKFSNLQLVPAEPLVGGPGAPNSGLTDEQRIMVQRFSPEKDPLREVEDIYRDTIGFFIASFTKTH